ncbi:MAG: isoprenylcysteine carboxylmethyltransferase family protein [Acidobacteriota bacterium]|jgi:protein-S-isoprenylcysteine O-methyltransferase Ste14
MIKRTLFLLYGVLAYLAFLPVFLYAIGFVGNFYVPKSMDRGGAGGGLLEALLVDGGLLLLFALQHSVMARQGFKRWWTKVVPRPVERSTFVLAATAALALLMWAWQPLGGIVWDLSGTGLAPVLIGVSLLGWGVVFLSTFLIDHFDLFGLGQVWAAFRGREYHPPRFYSPSLYKVMRHPLYFGFIVAFWATPVMTWGHLLFAAGTTGYILVAIRLEERDLVHFHGDAYREYRRRVRMLLPLPKSGAPDRDAAWDQRREGAA